MLIYPCSPATQRFKVVYGDTDSIFVLFEGRSVPEAFRLGRQIAEAVTATCPHPMELELEKVYSSCLLQAKKRYVGLMYESEASFRRGETPVLDVKGLESVRRDQPPATVKVLDRALRILLSTKDISAVKSYVLRQCDKLHTGRVSLHDCIIATEVLRQRAIKPRAIHCPAAGGGVPRTRKAPCIDWPLLPLPLVHGLTGAVQLCVGALGASCRTGGDAASKTRPARCRRGGGESALHCDHFSQQSCLSPQRSCAKTRGYFVSALGLWDNAAASLALLHSQVDHPCS